MAVWKGVYTLNEDLKILHYIMEGNYGRSTSGDGIWKKMEEEGIVPGRPWQGLKNRWRRHISVDLGRPEYGLIQEQTIRLKSEMVLGGKIRTREKVKTEKQPKSEQETDSDDESSLSDPATKKDKKFFSLDMNWSDDDTE